jgi:glycerophosphoryl diester phosphodiesterase
MKQHILFFAWIFLVFHGCNKDTTVPVPTAGPNSVMNETYPLNAGSKTLMDGVYKVTEGYGFFGDQVVVKWNRKSLTISCSSGKYFVLQAGQLDSVIFVQGYWRNGYNDGTGLISMYIARDEGGTMIVTGNGNQQITMRGAYGTQSGLPDQPLTLTWLRPFSDKVKNSTFHILAHRGGGRTSDRLPVSENSIAMIGFTEQLGSTGIEVDVRLSKDGVPFLYHDGDINIRLTQKCPIAGPPENFTWAQLSTFIRLIHGELMPTLEEALIYTIDSTLLTFVYLDMKGDPGSMEKVIPIQHRMLERAREKGRNIIIVIGIPNTDVMNELMLYPNYQNVPSLCELSVEDVRIVNSAVWAPRWTLGTQNDLVQEMHSEGRLAVCWTIDQPGWIEEYINDGQFDGLLTNFPYVVAYYHYIQQ